MKSMCHLSRPQKPFFSVRLLEWAARCYMNTQVSAKVQFSLFHMKYFSISSLACALLTSLLWARLGWKKMIISTKHIWVKLRSQMSGCLQMLYTVNQIWSNHAHAVLLNEFLRLIKKTQRWNLLRGFLFVTLCPIPFNPTEHVRI